jgi:tRNA1Val (adenine37-N6)-methyltransferase
MYGNWRAITTTSSFCQSILILSTFHFNEFVLNQFANAHKVGTDSMLLGAVINASNNKIALDIGAGTGVLALMLAQRNSSIKITCVEIDQKSAEECKNNVKKSPWFNRIETINAEFTQYNFQQKFDLIFTNPPYYLTNNSSSESNERTKHITPEALQSWLNKIADLLTKKGDFWMIWPSETSLKIIEMAHDTGLYVSRKINIYSKKNKLSRNILCFNCEKKEVLNEQLIIRNEDNSYSDAYCTLTSDFHFKEFNR